MNLDRLTKTGDRVNARERIVASILWLDKRNALIKIASLLIVMPFVLLIASFSKRFERFWGGCIYQVIESDRD